MTSFQKKVYNATKTIPRGKVMPYAALAAVLGMPHAARAVGNALGKNRSPDVPCHRVVRSDGSIGGYAWGTRRKMERLREENVEIYNGYIDLKTYGIIRIK